MQDKPTDPAPVAAAPAPTASKAADPVVAAVPTYGPITTTELPPAAPPPPETAPPTATLTPVAVAAPVKDSRAAYVYTLVSQDTLYGVSRRFGVPVKTLYDINGFEPNAILRVGQKVLLPEGAVDKGPEARANGATLAPLGAALASTAQGARPTPAKAVTKPATSLPPPPLPKPKTDPASATAQTRVQPQAQPQPQPKPTTATTTVAARPPAGAVKPTVTPPAATVAEAKAPATAPIAKAAAKPLIATPPPAVAGFPTNSQLAQMGKGLFAWPLKGKILVPFGQLAPNVRNDGINIAASTGTDVTAAADGVVVYQGDQVPALGNTIYVKHPNGWYTGYSHLSVMKVTNNQKVTKGQVIGSVGDTGTIDQPQLHFEVRYTPSTDIARPIDPKLVLP
ncbi:M23 family metallopeptidase [Asticcacaulis sp. AC402]|uniref:M23 family metallopeptidase n=1 Tax=Asticcacaulis sp. AC402 TaxID=1282361 RepID=UPI0003C3C706|nr:M23 family metallopeptidase [Asticcacaulis sp. AC402]ESQ76373.1 hypothetical protein ABAC402_04545 [Asticcacaulis sp. AC402]